MSQKMTNMQRKVTDMNYQEARGCIKESLRFGHEMNLKAISLLLERMGHPEKSLRFVHIAGTNGKGSVNAHLASVLKEAGYRAGRFVSPTLYGYRERIQINDTWISEEDFAEGMSVLWPHLTAMHDEGLACPSPFEIETALSFWYFKKMACDIVVLECGMGGETDATNVIQNTLVAVLASVSMDHMEYLGDTLAKITRTKAGILKPGAVMVTGRQQPEVIETLKAVCEEKKNQLIIANPDQAVVKKSTLEEQVFTYDGLSVTIHLAGAHQIDNAVLAIEAARQLRGFGFAISDEQIAAGMAKTVWNGRFTRIGREPDFLVDGAHNPDAARRLKEAMLKYYRGRRFIFIIAMFKDKQVEKIMEQMAPMAEYIYAMETPDNDRAMPARQLAGIIRRYNPHVTACKTMQEAVYRAVTTAGREAVIVAFGSLSFIGELTQITKEEYNRR